MAVLSKTDVEGKLTQVRTLLEQALPLANEAALGAHQCLGMEDPARWPAVLEKARRLRDRLEEAYSVANEGSLRNLPATPA